MTHIGKKPPALLSKRAFVAGSASLLSSLASAYASPKLDLDGLYNEPWLAKSSGSLATDFAEAAKSAKNFAILWEMRGCPWCKLLHMENFAREDIAAYLRANFSLVQLNIRGKRELSDFDGEKLTEEDLSYKYGINSTPTFQFFKPSDAAAGQDLGRAGYLKPVEFLTLLRFIREKGYEKGSYEEWVKTHKNPT
ncbi:MAG: thioredoxin family protein [Rhodomicrobium sp.]